MKGTLYLVATPIGNLEDISYRAVKVLKNSDMIYCEDTRVSSILLSHYKISKPLGIYETHREKKASDLILRDLDLGKNVCLVSDAGLPGISDPGERIIREACERGYPITVIPGANAGLSALLLSGFSAGKFFFEGFLPAKGSARRERLKSVLKVPVSVILYEAPHRIKYLLKDIEELAPNRKLSLSRELTKIHEETVRGTAAELSERFSEGIKGEIVLVISAYEDETLSEEKVIELIKEKLGKNLSQKDLVREISKETGRSKNDIYDLSLKLREGEK